MKSDNLLPRTLAALLFGAALAAACREPQPQSRTVTILHTNDTHSQIFPIADGKGRWAGYGGYARRARLIREIREEGGDVLLFDSGDFSQGTPYFNFYRGDIEIEGMNRMEYDAVTLGNHEFDNGMAELARRINRADFPVVSTNYDYADTPLEGKTLPFKIFNVKGVRIGVFGLTVNLQGMVEADHTRGIAYKDPIRAAQWAADTLRMLGADVVIALSHLGNNSTGFYLGDDSLVAKTSGIDLILGGHSHTDTIYVARNRQGGEVTVSQAASQGRLLGRVDMVLHKEK